MTHEDACAELLTAARDFYKGNLSREDWFNRVDALITAVEQRASVPQPAQDGAQATRRPSSRNYIVGGSPLHVSDRNLTPEQAGVAVRDAQ